MLFYQGERVRHKTTVICDSACFAHIWERRGSFLLVPFNFIPRKSSRRRVVLTIFGMPVILLQRFCPISCLLLSHKSSARVDRGGACQERGTMIQHREGETTFSMSANNPIKNVINNIAMLILRNCHCGIRKQVSIQFISTLVVILYS